MAGSPATATTTLPPFARHSKASRLGAIDAYARAPTQSEAIEAYLRVAGPRTRRQIADYLGIERSSVCGRAGPMLKTGRLVRAGHAPGKFDIANELLAVPTRAPEQGALL